jgi:hypothetical protein
MDARCSVTMKVCLDLKRRPLPRAVAASCIEATHERFLVRRAGDRGTVPLLATRRIRLAVLSATRRMAKPRTAKYMGIRRGDSVSSRRGANHWWHPSSRSSLYELAEPPIVFNADVSHCRSRRGARVLRYTARLRTSVNTHRTRGHLAPRVPVGSSSPRWDRTS